jgi:nicotinamidase-related amidase
MADWQEETFEDYQRKGFADRCGFGSKPVLLVVDFINGFTDPSTPLGGDFSAEIGVSAELLAAFRQTGLPVAFTSISYEPDLRDAGMWVKKVPSLAILKKGSAMAEVDARIAPRNGEYVVEKKYASAFFETDLAGYLRSLGVDTVIMVGCTTSGCIRSSAIDSISSGFHTIVVGDAVGDRAEGPHEANLFDIEAKYGDVVSSAEVLEYLRSVTSAGGFAAQARDQFQRWWNKAPGEVA